MALFCTRSFWMGIVWSALSVHALVLHSAVTDPRFATSDTVRIDLLESGDSLFVAPGAPFQLALPQDTSWNLCASSSGIEKCYQLKYLGSDSIVQLPITGDLLTVRYEDSSRVTIPEGSEDSVQVMDLPDSSSVAGLLGVEQGQQTLRKIVVQLRRKPKRKLGESVVSAKRIQRMPSLAEADVIRSIQALPGVVASSDFSTKIYVRGGGADQNLFLLDNGVVYSPVHFFGLFSTFLVEGIDDVKFYKSGFSPEYGNRLSSVVDIHSRKGGQDTSEAWFDKSSLKISTFATQAHTEGHKDNFRWVLAGRTTYIKEVLDALNKAGAIDFTLDYRFYDLQGHLAWDPSERLGSSLTYYGGADKLAFGPIYIKWGNTVVPYNLRFRPNDNWEHRITLAYSDFWQDFGIDRLFSLHNQITSESFKDAITFSGIDNHEILFGPEIQRFYVNFAQSQELREISYVDSNTFYLYSFFLQDTWRKGNLELTPGVRVSYQDLAEWTGVEPRLSASYQLPDDQRVSGHLGYYEQHVNSILFSDQETINEFYYPSKKAIWRTVPPTNSWLLALGYSKDRLKYDFHFDAETYYKLQDNLLVYAESELTDSLDAWGIEAGSDQSLADYFKSAEGFSFGYELSLRRDEGILNGGISWSQGWSVIKEQWDTVPYFPDWHQPYSLKVDLGITWKGDDGIWPYQGKWKGRYFRSSAQLKYASGMPYTEITGYARAHEIDQSTDGSGAGGPSTGFDDNYAIMQASRNGQLQPDYFRLDIKPVDIGREGKWSFAWTILNVTDHENVFMYNYNTETTPPKLDKITQFPFFPMLVNYEYYF